jgi:hypothetical protein
MARVEYRGHEIEVVREPSLGGQVLLYISIIRLNDSYVVEETPYDGSETVWEMIKYLKQRLDREIEDGTTYDPTLQKEEWIDGSPPEGDEHKVYEIRYSQYDEPVEEGLFVWSNMEKTWVEYSSDPFGLALYYEDGFEVVSWRNVRDGSGVKRWEDK